MAPSTTELGSYVRECRLKLNLSQASLAKKTGLAQSSISHFEVGTHKYLEDQQLKRLAGALHCDIEELRKRMLIKPEVKPQTEFSILIHSRREELGMSLEVFVQKMGMTVKEREYFKVRKSIGYNQVNLLAKVLNIETSVLAKFTVTTRKESRSELGQLVRSRRKERGLSGQMLAERLKVSRQLVTQIELGQCPLSNNPDMIARLAQILEIDVNRLEAAKPERKLKTKVNNANDLSGFLTAKRLELHLNQRELGELIDISEGCICAFETGRLRPGAKTLDKLSKAFGCGIPSELISL
jgi:transcriptional regulator with XRE-family HTH domain